MNWDEQKFDELERRVLATMRGNYAIVDVPYFRFFYGPGDGIEQICINKFQNLVGRINAEGFSAQCIFLSRLLIDSLRDLGLLDEEILRSESSERETFYTDLRSNLPSEIAKRLTEELGNNITNRRHCAVLLRLSALFPFVRAHQILQKIDSVVNCVLIIPYPASREGEMLWYKGDESNSYYRWQTI